MRHEIQTQEPLKRLPLAELILIIGLPLAVLVAGAFTTVAAYRQGFTPIPASTIAPKGH